MDRSLWLLLGLRIKGTLRRWARTLGSAKGALLAVVGSLVFVPTVATMLFTPRIQTGAQHDVIRRYGPLGLLVYCVLNVLLSSGDRSIYYAPAEINFLFTGPYRPRQLLLYKVVAALGAALFTAFFFTLAFKHHAARWLDSYVALALALALLYLVSLTVGLAISTVGALAFTRARRVVLLAVLAALVVAVAPVLNRASTMPLPALAERVVGSPVVAAAVLPFKPFVYAFTAERVWPDLVGWSAVALAIDLGLLGVVMAMNARFLEASASASARVYARLRRAKRQDGWDSPSKARFSLPMLPWLGGVGPNLWRQLTSSSRTSSKLAAVLLIYLIPVMTVLAKIPGSEGSGSEVATLCLAIIGTMALFTPAMLGFDFRADLPRMEVLKALPIRPTSVVVGELFTPVIASSLFQWLAVLVVAVVTRANWPLMAVAAAMVLPANFLLVAIENLFCLLFPFQLAGVNSFDIQTMGRQMLLLIAKGATFAAVGGIGGGLAWVIYRYGGESLVAATLVAWAVTLAACAGFVPLIAMAFESFDVAQTMPD